MKRHFLLLVLLCAAWLQVAACTSAIVAPRSSKDGQTLMWKHRDNTTWDTCIAYIEGGRYAYTALVNSYYSRTTGIYAGLNEAGLGVINTATSNLCSSDADAESNPLQNDTFAPPHYALMCEALRSCATVDDFEALLATYARSATYQSNIGISDSHGGAAYFEVWSDGYRRYDADKAAEGYLVRTNFSFAGDEGRRGKSVRRYEDMSALLPAHSAALTAEDFLGWSRSFYSTEKGDLLADNEMVTDDNWCVSRRTSVASVVIETGANPHMIVVVGNPVCGTPIPVWVAQRNCLPRCIGCGGDMQRLAQEYTALAYRRSSPKSKLYTLQKPVIRAALRAAAPIKIDHRRPTDDIAAAARYDARYEAYAARMRRVLSRF